VAADRVFKSAFVFALRPKTGRENVKLSLALAVKSSGSNRSSFCSSRGSRSPQLSQTRLIDRPREWQCCSSSGLYQGPLAQKSIFSLRFVFSLVRSRCYFVPFSVAGQTHIGKAKRENEKRRKAAAVAAAATAPTLSLSLSLSLPLSMLSAAFSLVCLLFSSLSLFSSLLFFHRRRLGLRPCGLSVVPARAAL
jgi:hypothetical protein